MIVTHYTYLSLPSAPPPQRSIPLQQGAPYPVHAGTHPPARKRFMHWQKIKELILIILWVDTLRYPPGPSPYDNRHGTF